MGARLEPNPRWGYHGWVVEAGANERRMRLGTLCWPERAWSIVGRICQRVTASSRAGRALAGYLLEPRKCTSQKQGGSQGNAELRDARPRG